MEILHNQVKLFVDPQLIVKLNVIISMRKIACIFLHSNSYNNPTSIKIAYENTIISYRLENHLQLYRWIILDQQIPIIVYSLEWQHFGKNTNYKHLYKAFQKMQCFQFYHRVFLLTSSTQSIVVFTPRYPMHLIMVLGIKSYVGKVPQK